MNGFIKELYRNSSEKSIYYKCPNEESYFEVLHKKKCRELFNGTMFDSNEYCYVLNSTCKYSSFQFCGIDNRGVTNDRCSVVCPTIVADSTSFPPGVLCNGVRDCSDGEDERNCGSETSERRCTFDKSIILPKGIWEDIRCDESNYKCGGGFHFYDEIGCNHETGKMSNISKPRDINYWWLHPIFMCDPSYEAWYSEEECENNNASISCIDFETKQTRLVPYIMTCTNPSYVKGSKFQICENWEEQMNCTLNQKHIALSCRVRNYGVTSLTKYLICNNQSSPSCVDELDEKCQEVATGCRIHQHQVCDGSTDCPLGEDEIYCDKLTSTQKCIRRVAINDKRPLRILKSHIMDGDKDCENGYDEDPVNWKKCGKGNRKHYTEKDEICQEYFFCGQDNEHIEPVPMGNLCDMKKDCPGEREICFKSREYKRLWTKRVEVNDILYIPPCLPGLELDMKFDCTNDLSPNHVFKVDAKKSVNSRIKQSCANQFGEQYLYSTCNELCEEKSARCKIKRAPSDGCHGSQSVFVNTLLFTEGKMPEVIKVMPKQRTSPDWKFEDNVFQCDNGHCVTTEKICNLANDCGDGSDERDCINQFQCNISRERLTWDKMCDGVVNCVDFSDECNDICSNVRIISMPYLRIFSRSIGLASSVINVLVLIKSFYKLKTITNKPIVLRDNLLISLIAFGDLLVGIYLISITIVDANYGDIFCEEQFNWTSSLMCNMLGVLSTLGSQFSLFTMTILSVYRVHRITHLFDSPHISKLWWGFTAMLCIFIGTSALLISIIPIFSLFEDFFINGLGYHGITLFVGLVDKHIHFEVLKSYYGKLWGANSGELSWRLIRSMIASMFSSDQGEVQGEGVGFYGNAGVCLFKYFVTPNDPQQLFSLAVLLINFICFGAITISYIIVLVASKLSVSTKSTRLVELTNSALQRKISLIILSDALCWVPFIFIGLLHYFKAIDASPLYEFCSIIILPVNSLINPIIYNAEFHEYKEFLRNYISRVMPYFRMRKDKQSTGNSNKTSTTVCDMPCSSNLSFPNAVEIRAEISTTEL